MKRRHQQTVFSSITLLALIGCTDGQPADRSTENSATALTDAAAIYALHCASCHGVALEGGGRGPALALASFADRQGDLMEIIARGAVEQGMPGFDAVLSGSEIADLADYLVSFEPQGGVTPEAETPQTLRSFDAVPGIADTLDYDVRADIFVDGLEIPWALAFLEDETALATERRGRLRLVHNGVLADAPVNGTPEVLVSTHEWNQGGLMDVAVDPDYAENGWIYLAYSHRLPGDPDESAERGMTRVVRGRIRGNDWVDQETIFEADPSAYSETAWHYGGRMAIDSDGSLFVSVGDRGVQDEARLLRTPNGKVHRVQTDGGIPPDNPFTDHADALASIFSYGNRNPQGLAIAPNTGALWQTEHGPRGGDELNVITSGGDYGWPIVSYGINYDGTVLTPNTRREGTEQPVYFWRPSIAVSGLTFYDGKAFPLWRGKLLVTGLSSRDLRLLTLDGDRVQHEEIIFRFEGRPYEPVVGPDGSIYVVTDAPGQVIRLSAEEERPR